MRNVLRKIIFAGLFIGLVRDPRKTEKIFKMSDNGSRLDNPLLHMALESVRTHENFRKLIDENYQPRAASLDELRKLSSHTFGYRYAKHMLDHDLKIDFFPRPNFPAKEDREISFMIMRGRQSHDMWHALTEFNISIPDELGLQAFTLAQFDSAISAVILAAGVIHIVLYEPLLFRETIKKIQIGYRMGKKADFLLGEKLEEMWNEDLNIVRQRLHIEPLTTFTS